MAGPQRGSHTKYNFLIKIPMYVITQLLLLPWLGKRCLLVSSLIVGWTRCPEKAGYPPSPWSFYALAVLHLDGCTWAIPTSELTSVQICCFMLINITEWLSTGCSDFAASLARVSCPDGFVLSENMARERLCLWSSCSRGAPRLRMIALPYRYAFNHGLSWCHGLCELKW